MLATLAAALSSSALAQAPSGFAQSDHANIAYFTFGRPTAKTPVLVVNGGPGFAHTYFTESGVWQKVAHDRLVVMYDQRGTGASKRLSPGVSFDMADQIGDIDAVRRSLHIQQFILAGDSYGGFLALGYVLAHPSQVAKLVLSDAPGANLSDKRRLLSAVFPDRLSRSTPPAPRTEAAHQAEEEENIQDHLSMYFYSQTKAKSYIARASTFGYVAAIDDAVSKEAEQSDYGGRLTEITAPVLVLNGRYDLNVPPLTAWSIAHVIPHARNVFFETSGHFPAYEEPEKYLSVIEQFIEG